jgi:steroid Delta-isomerase
MPGPAVETIKRFGAVEDDQRYTRLVELFTDDAVYYDPFAGPQRGRDAIAGFMAHMEVVVPKAGVRFLDWEVEADTTCGWAKWTMAAPDASGVDVPVPGQSLYRLRDGKVSFVADYVDPLAYRKLRPGGPVPDAESSMGISTGMGGPPGRGHEVLKHFWALQDSGDYALLAPLFTDDAVFTDLIYGDFHGGPAIAAYMEKMKAEMPAHGITFELVDVAGDDTVGWTQWWCHFPKGRVAGWTLHTVRDGLLTLDSDFFDTLAARRMRGVEA